MPPLPAVHAKFFIPDGVSKIRWYGGKEVAAATPIVSLRYSEATAFGVVEGFWKEGRVWRLDEPDAVGSRGAASAIAVREPRLLTPWLRAAVR